jgi:hypothetical protein
MNVVWARMMEDRPKDEKKMGRNPGFVDSRHSSGGAHAFYELASGHNLKKLNMADLRNYPRP